MIRYIPILHPMLLITGAKNMSIKTIFEKDTGKILGAQIIGFDGVDKRCDVLATAIRAWYDRI